MKRLVLPLTVLLTAAALWAIGRKATAPLPVIYFWDQTADKSRRASIWFCSDS